MKTRRSRRKRFWFCTFMLCGGGSNRVAPVSDAAFSSSHHSSSSRSKMRATNGRTNRGCWRSRTSLRRAFAPTRKPAVKVETEESLRKTTQLGAVVIQDSSLVEANPRANRAVENEKNVVRITTVSQTEEESKIPGAVGSGFFGESREEEEEHHEEEIDDFGPGDVLESVSNCSASISENDTVPSAVRPKMNGTEKHPVEQLEEEEREFLLSLVTNEEKDVKFVSNGDGNEYAPDIGQAQEALDNDKSEDEDGNDEDIKDEEDKDDDKDDDKDEDDKAEDDKDEEAEPWQRRNARSVEDGIRRAKSKKTRTATKLSSLLDKAGDALGGAQQKTRKYAARTVAGLINALADEVDDLVVEIDSRNDSPFWSKEVNAVSIEFSRLGFRPLRMGGLEQFSVETTSSNDSPLPVAAENSTGGSNVSMATRTQLADLSCADEAFERFDADNSGALDRDEIAKALAAVGTGSSSPIVDDVEKINDLASDLVQLYDFDGDGFMDRNEYQSMVEDMAALREAQRRRQKQREERNRERERRKQARIDKSDSEKRGWFYSVKNLTMNVLGWQSDDSSESNDVEDETISKNKEFSAPDDSVLDDDDDPSTTDSGPEIVNVSQDAAVFDSMTKALGSIVVSDLKLDLRRLFFGAVPLLKRITPGGPLVLEPFTVTITGSFNRDDIMDSFLLNAGLRDLVARALRRRLRVYRDFADMAVFYGRSWKMFSESAPFVELPELTDVQFDDDNRLIITGRARLRSRPDAPLVENAFKVRTRIGTRKGGRVIRLVEPELALVLECPQWVEERLARVYQRLGLEMPPRPEPIYSFFPIYSPFKVSDKDGFDLGEDNCIKAIYVQNGALRFELSAVLRPGRFLGNHYVAFTIPNRTFIITLDRVKEGMRAARKMKKAARALQQAAAHRVQSGAGPDPLERENPSKQPETTKLGKDDAALRNNKRPREQPKSFFSRFVNGYLQADREESDNERLTTAIRDWFGRQGANETLLTLEELDRFV